MINIVCTSKPVDGLLYYSYEYCSLLNSAGIDARVVIVPHRKFKEDDYINSINNKYIHCKNVEFSTIPNRYDITLIMGRSMMTLSWINFKDYTREQQESLKQLFSNNIIAVYSENHPTQYPLALEFYKPKNIIDLCDYEVYPNGAGDHFEKTINFEIYKPVVEDIQFKYLFLGTNDMYYSAAEECIKDFPNYGILTYHSEYVNIENNNIFVPVENLMGLFEVYVYTKKTFDPAPRIFQECKFYGKEVIYYRDKNIRDGGSIYWKRDIKLPDISPIISAIKDLK